MHSEVAELLLDIEGELRQLGLWQKTPPSAGALASTEPFAVDTLTLSQWLQFIFLPTMYKRMEQGLPLPQRCGIAPMAQEYYKASELAITGLLVALQQVDVMLSTDNDPPKEAD